MKKVVLIASVGGHWVQLLRLKPAFLDHEMIYISTKSTFSDTVEDCKFYSIPDGNRKDKKLLVKSFYKVLKIIKKEKPDVIITTGAAPGLMGLLAGKLLGSKTVWIDSIANASQLSLSGKLASIFVSRVYTQWPELATDKIYYSGNVLS